MSEALILASTNPHYDKYCSLIYQFSTWKLQAQYMETTSSEHVVYINCFLFWHSEQFMYTTCSELVIFMYWTRNSMNNLLSYCGLVDARIRASDKDLPVNLHYCTSKPSSFSGNFRLHTYLLTNAKLQVRTLKKCDW